VTILTKIVSRSRGEQLQKEDGYPHGVKGSLERSRREWGLRKLPLQEKTRGTEQGEKKSRKKVPLIGSQHAFKKEYTEGS